MKHNIVRSYQQAQGTQTTLGSSIVDITVRNELGGSNNPELHELQVTGVCTSTIEDAVHHLIVYVGRTSTHPSSSDAGVRVRTLPANPTGIPFFVRFKALKIRPGEALYLHTEAAVENSSSTIHRNIMSVKDVYYEL